MNSNATTISTLVTPQQQETILRAIYVSSNSLIGGVLISTQERQQAFQVLQDFSINFQHRLPLCLDWLQQPALQFTTQANQTVDCTIPAKLYACEIVFDSLKKTHYSENWTDNERWQLKQALLVAAKQQTTAASASATTTSPLPLANKLASLLASLMIRDFPQRWTTCISDLFGQLWNTNCEESNCVGNRMCLQILQLVAEDCTDSDFNSKISTKRRNDILLGLNEVSDRFLPLLYHSLEQITALTQARINIHDMRRYMISNSQSLSSLTQEQRSKYNSEQMKITNLSTLILNTLKCMEKFCKSMPLEWIISNAQYDFITAFFYLMREPTNSINVVAVECLEQLALRGKLTYSQWMHWIEELPSAIQHANTQVTQQEMEYYQLLEAIQTGRYQNPQNIDFDALTFQYEFHRAASRMLSAVISSHISYISQDKTFLKARCRSNNNDIKNENAIHFVNYLSFLVDILQHPSGRVISEQLNLWITLLRDPQISSGTDGGFLDPIAGDILTCFIRHMVKFDWDDMVEDDNYPNSALLQASWEDEDDYVAWANDYRSKSSRLYKLIGNVCPQIAAMILYQSFESLMIQFRTITNENSDHLDPVTQQLTQASKAVREFEGLVHPIENVLSGIPIWVMNGQGKSSTKTNGTTTQKQREVMIVQTSLNALSSLAQEIISFNPNYLWLKFRKAQLLESLKHFWLYNPSTLLQGIECLLTYIGAPDEWGGNPQVEADGTKKISVETVGFRKKSSMALVAVSKVVPHHLVPWLSQLSDATRRLLSAEDLLQTNRMHLYEFLTVVATAVEDSAERSNFVSSVLAGALNTLQSAETQEVLASVDNFLVAVGIVQAGSYPESVSDISNVKAVTNRFSKIFSAFNELLGVGKRCHEAAMKRPNSGIPVAASSGAVSISIPDGMSVTEAAESLSFPDEGPVSIRDLSVDDPFIPLWPQILPSVLKMLDILFRMWRPEWQARLLSNSIQRYALAISDDEAFLSKKTDGKNGGVFGEGGTAGSIIPGTDRRDMNLAPRWSTWFNESRNTLYQMLGLLASQRALFAPEISEYFPQIIAVVVDPENLRGMEHRQMSQYLKQFTEVLLLSCPPPLYPTHLAPILGPVLEHLRYRLEKTWEPILEPSFPTPPQSCKPLSISDCDTAASLASRGGESWYLSYYARSCAFVGALDSETAEAAVEKYRVELSRVCSDMIQAGLALKGEWALVLANLIKEEEHRKKDGSWSSPSKASRVGAPNQIEVGDFAKYNADGTPKKANQSALDARTLKRINALNHFLFLENEMIAGFLTLIIIQSLSYADTYTCRRITRICHRVLETVAWHPRYTDLLGRRMLAAATKNIVTEPKWMVGVEWDMINVFRDIYCRLVLGQTLQAGGQGAGLQQPVSSASPVVVFEQAKSADRPLQGGGILSTPSELPHQLLVTLPGITLETIQKLDEGLKTKRSAKDQKDAIRDFLRVAADEWKENEQPNVNGGSTGNLNVLDRAVAEESLLHNGSKGKVVVGDIPGTVVTRKKSKAEKAHAEASGDVGLAAFSLFN